MKKNKEYCQSDMYKQKRKQKRSKNFEMYAEHQEKATYQKGLDTVKC